MDTLFVKAEKLISKWRGRTMKRILVTGNILGPKHLDKLRAKGFEVHNVRENLNEDELMRALAGKHVYVLGGLECATKRVIEGAHDLELISFAGVGFQQFIAFETATKLGIAITNTPGAMVDSVAELTVGFLIDLNREISYLDDSVRDGKTPDVIATDLRGQTAGIIGLGAIGTRVAQILVYGFGMKVIYHNRSPRLVAERQLNISRVSLEELLSTSDAVSLHVPLTKETEGMIGARQLSLMKPRALLVNTARASLIDGHALYKALVLRQLGGAAFDGYYKEPIPSVNDDPWKLLSLRKDTFMITPHIAAATEDSRKRMSEMVVESIISFFRTGDDLHLTNPQYRLNRRRES